MEIKMKESKSKILSDSLPVILFAVLFVGIVAFFRSQLPGFFLPASVYSILRKIASISLAATGLTFVIIIGKCDMSFHLVGCCTGVCFCWLMVYQGVNPCWPPSSPWSSAAPGVPSPVSW